MQTVEEVNEPYRGVITLQYIPWDEEEFKRLWLPLRDASGKVLREPLMSESDKARYPIEIEQHNCLTLDGKNLLLDFMGLAANAPPFAAYLAIGNGFTSGVSPSDSMSTFAGEYARKAVTGYTKIGNQNALSIYLASTDAVGTMTHIGLVGGSAATLTFGTGLLSTHSLFPYTKAGLGALINYVITQA